MERTSGQGMRWAREGPGKRPRRGAFTAARLARMGRSRPRLVRVQYGGSWLKKRGKVPAGLNDQAGQAGRGPGVETVKFSYVGICYRENPTQRPRSRARENRSRYCRYRDNLIQVAQREGKKRGHTRAAPQGEPRRDAGYGNEGRAS